MSKYITAMRAFDWKTAINNQAAQVFLCCCLIILCFSIFAPLFGVEVFGLFALVFVIVAVFDSKRGDDASFAKMAAIASVFLGFLLVALVIFLVEQLGAPPIPIAQINAQPAHAIERR